MIDLGTTKGIVVTVAIKRVHMINTHLTSRARIRAALVDILATICARVAGTRTIARIFVHTVDTSTRITASCSAVVDVDVTINAFKAGATVVTS